MRDQVPDKKRLQFAFCIDKKTYTHVAKSIRSFISIKVDEEKD